MKKFFTLTVILFTSVFYGQVAPGGYSTSLRGWYNASTGYGLSGGAVSTWSDQSGNGLHGSQTSTASRPVPNASAFNYNQAFSFDGLSDFINIPDQMASTATGMTAFVVARQTATNRDNHGTILAVQASPTGTGGGFGFFAASPFNNIFGFGVDNYATNAVYNVTSVQETALFTGNFNGTSAGNVQYFFNGTSQGTNGFAGQVGDNGTSFIGSALSVASNSYCFYGDIAEVAIYSVGLNASNTQKVESYLALKYGITKAGNYVNSSGTTVFTVAAPYNNDIIGIGRDDNTLLNQRQSKSYDDTIRLYINNNLAATNAANGSSFSSNNQFVIIGHNNGRMSGQLTEKPASIYSRLAREWKITNTGFPGNFNFDIRLNGISIPTSINGAHLRLLVDDDGDFSNATVYNLGINFSNPWIEVNNIGTGHVPINTTKYITIGSVNSNSPLPIELFTWESLLCNSEVCLKWSTATEKNNERFEIERTANGEDWSRIGTVAGAVNSSTIKNYEFVDKQPLPDVSYYRLKQIDLNGDYSYSPVSSVSNHAVDEIKMFPNPANDQVVLTQVFGEVKVINALGADVSGEMQRSFLSNGDLQLRTSTLMNGIYYVQVYRSSNAPVKVFKLFVRH